MSIRTRNLATAGDALQTGEQVYLPGDIDPAEFDYLTIMTNDQLFSLFLRNSKVQKATSWFAGEVIRERWEFATEQPITGPKFGIDYPFKTFNGWLEWNGFIQEVLKAITWSLLFGEAIIIFYDGTELDADNYQQSKSKFFTGGNDFNTCKAFYPWAAGNGYYPRELDPFFGIPNVYQVNLMMDKADQGVEYYVGKDRVVRFSAPQKSLRYSGTSTVSTVAKDALIQEQIKRSIAVQSNLLQSGILALKASTEKEKDLIKNSIGDSLSHLRRVYVKNIDDIENFMRIFIPDLKIDQFDKLYEILQKDIATGIDMSISNLEGAPQGAQSSAAYDTLNTYAKVKQLQSHYTRAMEESFRMFGKDDTTFEWNDPTPHILPTPTNQTLFANRTILDEDKVLQDDESIETQPIQPEEEVVSTPEPDSDTGKKKKITPFRLFRRGKR